MCTGEQEQSAEWEQERLDLSSEISKLKEHNERLSSELNIRSMTVDKLKNKVRPSDLFRANVFRVGLNF